MLRSMDIGAGTELEITDARMLVVVISGSLLVATADTKPYGNIAPPAELRPRRTQKRLHIVPGTPESREATAPGTPWTPQLGGEQRCVGGMSSEDWRVVFDDTDTDKSGALSTQEIWALLTNCGLEVEYDDVEKIVLELDADGRTLAVLQQERSIAAAAPLPLPLRYAAPGLEPGGVFDSPNAE